MIIGMNGYRRTTSVVTLSRPYRWHGSDAATRAFGHFGVIVKQRSTLYAPFSASDGGAVQMLRFRSALHGQLVCFEAD